MRCLLLSSDEVEMLVFTNPDLRSLFKHQHRSPVHAALLLSTLPNENSPQFLKIALRILGYFHIKNLNHGPLHSTKRSY